MIEIINDELIKSAEEFGFDLTLLGAGSMVKIKSKLDVWYTPNLPHRNSITLYHENIFGKGSWHKQGVFKSFYAIMDYIKKHDMKYSI